MKKFVICFLLLGFIFVIGFNAFASSNGEIIVSNISGKPGEIVSVAINIKNNPGLIAMRMFVEYDNNKLSLFEVKDGNIFGEGNSTFNNNISSNPYTLLWEDALTDADYVGDGTLATLKFRILDSAVSEKADIIIELDKSSTFNKNLIEQSFSVSNGSVNINGDADQTISTSHHRYPKTTTQTNANIETTKDNSKIMMTFSKCNHEQIKWNVVKESTCVDNGKKKAVCAVCDMVIRVEAIPLSEHKMTGWKKDLSSVPGETIEIRNCNNCSYQETRKVAENSTVIITHNNCDELTSSEKETVVSEYSQKVNITFKESVSSSNSLVSETEMMETSCLEDIDKPNNELVINVTAVVVLLSIIFVIFFVVKNKKESR